MEGEIYCCKGWVDYPTPGNDTQCPTCHSVFHVKAEAKELMPLDVPVSEQIARVLGQDDWAIYARTVSGRLVYAIMELWSNWADAPHGGLHECDCPEKNMATCRIDNSWMHMYVVQHANDIEWLNAEGVVFHPGHYAYFIGDTQYVDDSHTNFHEAMGWPIEKDNEFMANSRKNYLCD